MPSNLPQYPLRTSKETLEKMKAIAAKHNRTLNKEIEYVLLQYIEQNEEIQLKSEATEKKYTFD